MPGRGTVGSDLGSLGGKAMTLNPYLTQQLREERVKDALRNAEQARLIRVARGPRKSRGWRLPVALILSSLLALLMRPQS
jgi:hypothetical protein